MLFGTGPAVTPLPVVVPMLGILPNARCPPPLEEVMPLGAWVGPLELAVPAPVLAHPANAKQAKAAVAKILLMMSKSQNVASSSNAARAR